MFAREHKQEYDPSSSPLIERPLATGRPLSVQVQGNAYGGKGLEGLRKEQVLDNSKIPVYSPPRLLKKFNEISNTPSKVQLSPTKSSMSSKSRYALPPILDVENGGRSDDDDSMGEHELPPGKSLHRHAKSVTFDAAPPQINEYEMTTPDPSSVASGSREGSYESVDNEEDDSSDLRSSIERDDSFDDSLEDTDKTPVVLPEDWRFISPATANDNFTASVGNPLNGHESSPGPSARPSSAVDARSSPTRTDSANSSGERRPLPPLPALGMPLFPRIRSDSTESLSTTVERVSSTHRVVASLLRPASITKSEIQDMGRSSMSLEDRLRLMMTKEEQKIDSQAEAQQEGYFERNSPSMSLGNEEHSENLEFGVHENDTEGLREYRAPRISRESILRKVKGQTQPAKEDDYGEFSPTPSFYSSRDQVSELDPDTPIPSTEAEPLAELEPSVFIKQEDAEDSELDIYSIPDLYSQQVHNEPYNDVADRQLTFKAPIRGSSQNDDDDDSHYSQDYQGDEQQGSLQKILIDEDSPSTPRALEPIDGMDEPDLKNDEKMTLPQFSSMLEDRDFGFGLESFLTPSPPLSEQPIEASCSSKPTHIETISERPVTPEAQLEPPRYPGQWNDLDDEPRTPDSVIRHPIARSPSPESPSVPEPEATIKAPGGKLKTRPSLTPADARAMAETRRQVSQEHPAVPQIPEKHLSRPSVIVESDASTSESETLKNDVLEKDSSRQSNRKSSLVQLEIPVGKGDDGLGFGLNQEFDRLIEAQKVASTFPSLAFGPQSGFPGHAEYMAGQGFKPYPQNFANTPIHTQKGYLMRQNTKIVIASSASHESATDTIETVEHGVRGTRSAGNSPRKPSQPHPWTTEPWNGKVRRKSLRQSGGSPQKKSISGSAPPLPGQQSNVASGLGSVTEDEAMLNSDEVDDGGERGVLFVKVVRVKDLDLPLPKGIFSF